MGEPVHGSNLFSSVRRVLATLLEIAQVRLALLETEIEQEKRRLLAALLWGALAVVLLGLGMLMLCFLVILAFWEGYRVHATAALAAIFLVGGMQLMRAAWKRIQSPSGMFGGSLGELKQDCSALRPSDQYEQ